MRISFNLITAFGKKANIVFFQFFDNDKGLLYINGCLRVVAVIVMAHHFATIQPNLSHQDIRLIRMMLLVFFLYNAILGLVGVLHPEWFMRKWVKTVQSIFEILIYSLFYYSTYDPRAEVYFLYFIPLFFAVHFLDFGLALGMIAFGALNLYVVLAGLASLPAEQTGGVFNQYSFWNIFGLRVLILISMSLAYAIRRRASIIQELQFNHSQFGDLLRSMDEGLFIIDMSGGLLFVNDILQKRHGSFHPRQACTDYFLSENNEFKWDVHTGHLINSQNHQKNETRFVDKDGTAYQVEVNLKPLLGDAGQYNTAIGIVRDLNLQRQLLVQFDTKIKTYMRQVKTITSQHTRLQETYYELGKRLTGFENLDELMKFVVNEVKVLLNAETASIFLLQNNVLRRCAISGIDENWLHDEHYKIGDGITGQVIISQFGSKYGRAIRRNQVDNDPEVISHFLQAYKDKLKSHQVSHLVAVPLNGQEKPFGVLRVVNKLNAEALLDIQGFSESDQDFLVAIASIISVAVENSRLLEDARKRYQQATALYAIGQHITQAKDWEELGQVIVDETRGMFADSCKAIIYLIDEPSGSLVIQASSERNVAPSGFPPLNYSQGIAGKAISQKTIIRVLDIDREPEFVKRGDSNIHSLMVAPLLSGDQVIGILSVDSDRTFAFHEDDERLLGMLANQASIAIEKAQLYKQESESRRQAYALLEVSRKINANLNLNNMLAEALDELAKVVPYSSISIQLVQGSLMKIIACRGFKIRKKIIDLSFPLRNRKYPNSEVFRMRAPVMVDDVRISYPHFYEEAHTYASGHIRSWMGIPLIYRQKVLGMISIDHSKPNFYTEDMASLALTFANQVTTALINARLFREKNQQLSNLDSLFQASHIITAAIEINDVLKKIAELAKQVCDADHAAVMLLGEEEERLDSFETRYVTVPLHERARKVGVTTKVLESRKPVIFNHVHQNDGRHNPMILQAGYQSYAGLPIMKGERILGVLFVHSNRPDHFHRSREIPLLKALCSNAAIAIDNALLYKESARQSRVLARLVETSNELIQHTDLKDLLNYCAQKASEIFQVEDCSIYLKDRERNTIDLACSTTIPPDVWPKRDIFMDGPGLTAFAARTGETLNFGKDEYREHPAWSGKFGIPFEDHLQYLPSKQCHSLLISPLKNNLGENIGVLKLENRIGFENGRKFSDFDVAMNQTYASHIATAVERARLYRRLDKNARRDARLALGYELHEIYNLIHGALVMRLEITKEKLLRKQLPEVRQELENMGKASRAANSLLRWIHYDLRGDDLIEEKGLIPTLQHIAHLLKVPVRTKVVGRDKLPLNVEYALYKIGVEALTNVAKHAGESTLASLSLKKSNEKYLLEVSDNGSGFDEVSVFQSSVTFGFEGMRRWAESIGGTLDIQTMPSRGTTISVSGSIIQKEKYYEG